MLNMRGRYFSVPIDIGAVDAREVWEGQCPVENRPHRQFGVRMPIPRSLVYLCLVPKQVVYNPKLLGMLQPRLLQPLVHAFRDPSLLRETLL